MATFGLSVHPKVNTSTVDRGLNECLRNSSVPEDLIAKLMDPAGHTRWKNLDTFYYHFEPDCLSAGIEVCLSQYPEYKKSKDPSKPNHNYFREQGHLRHAWHEAKALVAELATTPADADVDLDAPLPPDTHQDLDNRWMARYNVKIRPEFDPDETTITRYYRALHRRKCSLKVVPMQKHTAVGNSTGLATYAGIHSLYDYHSHMRIMANSMGKAGNFEFSCPKLGMVIMAPLDVNYHYVENAYERALTRNSLPWLRERDELTRTLMIKYMRAPYGWSQGAALEQAWADASFHWNDANLMKDRLKAGDTKSPNFVNPGAGAGGGGRRNGPPAGAPGKKKRNRGRGRGRNRSRSRGPSPERRGARVKREERSRSPRRAQKEGGDASKAQPNLFCPNAKGKRCCPDWNMGKRCQNKDCTFLHDYCNRRLISGGSCGLNHPAYRCNNSDRVTDSRNRSPFGMKKR